MMTKLIAASFLCFALLFISSCNTENETSLKYDFCSNIHKDTSTTLSEQLAPLQELTKNQTGTYLLEEGDISMILRGWLTEYAEQTIDIQYFIFSADNIGLISVDYLLRAANRGVKVRILVDDIMVDADANSLLALDAHPNISIKIYNPVANIGKNLPQKMYSLATDFKGFNQRMHNKTFTVDGKVVITGGRNIADEYFDYDHKYNFRDRDVLLLGKTTNTIQKSFNQFWDNSISVSINDLVDADKNDIDTSKMYQYLHQYACNPENFWPQVREKMKELPKAFQKMRENNSLVWVDSVEYVSDVPGKYNTDISDESNTTNKLVQLINKAKTSITIQSPYLITTEESRSLLQKAVERGVKIKILTNSLASTDNLEAFDGYQRDREDLLNTGVEIYEFKPDAEIRKKVMTGALQEKLNYTPIFGLHAKSMVIDNEIAVIGTFNLDPRSSYLNTECLTIIHSDEIANQLFETMKIDMLKENAWHTTLEFKPDAEAGKWKELKAKTRRVVPKSIL